MRKHCDRCGKFMHVKLHGACMSCLKDEGLLPPSIRALKEEGEYKRSIRGLKRSAITIICDQDWYAYKWDPAGNLRKILATRDERPYISDDVAEEIEGILEEVS